MGIVTNQYFKNLLLFLTGASTALFLSYFFEKTATKLIPQKVNKEVQKNYSKTNNELESSFNDLAKGVILQGNFENYEELSTSYLDKNVYEFLPWALITANKFKKPQAYFDVYYCLFEINCIEYNKNDLNNWSLENLDVETQKFAIAYLKRASEMGHTQATEILEIYKNNGKYIN
ncbi:hypothetical protein [Flavobacterium sp.]|jgi:hypothetical protein|uniref:hypothetical protein n=1 Tax=Flavobacterium sp. TaxID=239 RepID=UPI0022C0D763|nr:hypothetical protein [Flavobacterium sp.]MCZ8297690.1 hypothetical protein [Flavobacterium sp.]